MTTDPLHVTWETPDTDIGGTGFIPSRQVSKKDIAAYCTQHQLRIGMRLSHDRCQIDPLHHSHDATPVVLLPGGFYCYSCAGRHGNGFTPWSKIITAAKVTVGIDLLAAARHFVPWEHACYMMRSTVATADDKYDRVCKLSYSATLKLAHPDVDITSTDIYRRVFRHMPFVRGGGFWLHAASLLPVSHRMHRKTLEAFSSCRTLVITTPGTPPTNSTPDPIRIEQHNQDGLLPGMAEIVPIRGAPIYFVKNRSVTTDCIRVAPRKARDRVVYIPTEKRMSEDEIRAVLTSVYLGYDVSYTKLLMAAKGIAECGVGPIPEIFSHGVSASQKTGNIVVTAAALDDAIFKLTNQKEDNFGEAIGSGSRGCSFICGDEVFKQVTDFAHSQLRPILLGIDREFDYRKLNTGTVKAPFTSAILLCDTDKPENLEQDEQIGRRYIYNPMPERVPDWRTTRVDWREFWHHDEQHRHAFNSLYSNIIDEFFYEGSRMGFHEIAAELGYTTLEKYRLSSDTGRHIQERLVDFFWAVLAPAPSIPAQENQGPGWHLMPANSDESNHITQALEALAVQSCESSSQALAQVQRQDGRWRDLVGALHGCKCNVKHYRGKRYIRFEHGATKTLQVNQDLVPADLYRNKFPETGAAAT